MPRVGRLLMTVVFEDHELTRPLGSTPNYLIILQWERYLAIENIRGCEVTKGYVNASAIEVYLCG